MSTTAADLYSELEAKAQQAPAGGSYPELEAKGAQQAASADPYSELEARAGGATIPGTSSAASTTGRSGGASTAVPPELGSHPINDFVTGATKETLGSTAGAVGGGLRGLWDLALGRGANQAAADVEATEQGASRLFAPRNAAEAAGATTASSNWNPLNWPGVALSWTGRKLGGFSADLGAPPALSAALQTAPSAAALLYGPIKAAAARDWSPYKVTAEEASPAVPPGATAPAGAAPQSISAGAVGGGAIPQGAPEPDSAPVQGGLPKEYQDQRAAILARVGLGNARESAIEGDAKNAASDFLMSKFDEPGGRAAATQFEAERNALATHTENLIANTGGTIGMDEDALAQRGQTIARPFDLLRQYFDANTRRLYTEADQRAAGTPLTNLDGVDELLQDPQFRNTLLAKDQGNLLSAVGNQLERFREGNPEGFNAASAEQVRQWLNQVWSPDNKWAVGKLKDAIDDDVLNTAGDDIYQQARAQRQLKAQTLDNPKGISTLFSTDPATSINRTTPFEKIPDKLAQLPIDQFANVIQTLKNMPDELQPDAQAALGEIRGQLGNKLLQAGTQTAAGSARGLWGADRVANVLRTNAAKFRVAFADDPAAQSAIQDLNSAGQILKVDPSYPGAAAQAANALKRGLLSRALTHAGGAAGAGLGSVIAGPLGAAVGGAAGEAMGSSVGASASERAALRAWEKRTRTLTSPKPAQ